MSDHSSCQSIIDKLLMLNSEANMTIGELKTQLASAEKLHTTLKLRTYVEKLEELMRPPEISRLDWEAVLRFEKWRRFFSDPETYYIYEDLILNILSLFSNDVDNAAKNMKKMYGILNGRVHNYFDDKPITSTSFRELKLRKLAEFFDNIDL